MYPFIKKAVMALCMSLFCLVGNAQKTITGTVKDVAGDPLIGATVSLGGTNGVMPAEQHDSSQLSSMIIAC